MQSLLSWARLSLAAVAVACVTPASAQTLRQHVEAALARDADLASANARLAAERGKRGSYGAILAGAPTANADVESDAATNNDGFLSFGAGVAAPLWWPGQRQALLDANSAAVGAAQARENLARLDVAGRVREAYWRWARTQGRAALISRQVEQLETTAAATARLVTARETARADLLLAQAALVQAKTLQAQAQAELVQARAALVLLSGLPAEDAPAPETLPAQAPPPPALLLAQAEQALAEANRQALARSQWDNPSVGLGVTSEKDARGAERSNRFGLTLSVPLGRAPAAKREVIDASAAVMETAARTAQVERETQSAIAQARAGLEAAQTQAVLATDRAKTLRAVRDLYEQGRREHAVSLFDLIRAREAALGAELDAFEANAAVDVAISRLAQALGVLP